MTKKLNTAAYLFLGVGIEYKSGNYTIYSDYFTTDKMVMYDNIAIYKHSVYYDEKKMVLQLISDAA